MRRDLILGPGVASGLLSALSIAALCAGFLVLPEVSFAQTVIYNNSDKPLNIGDIGDEDNKPYAQLFAMPGAHMTTGYGGWPRSGAGFIQAVENRIFYVSFDLQRPPRIPKQVWGEADRKVAGIQVRKLEWDGSGKLVSVEGLASELDYITDDRFFGSGPSGRKASIKNANHINITSDIAKPKIVAGVLYLKLAGKGDQEYKLETSFQSGKSIAPDSFWTIFK